MKFKHCLPLLLLVLGFVSSAFASVSVPANSYLFTFPAYGTAMRFASAQSFTNVSRIGNFWLFDGFEFSVQNGNLTVDSLWAGNVFQGHVSGSDGQLAIVTIYDVSYSIPASVLCSSATVSQVLDSGSFLSSSSSVWFYDTGSGRMYLKLLISGYTSFSADYNAAPPGPGPGPSGISSSASSVQVSDCTVNVASGGSATALIGVSWNFMGSVSLTAMSFQGDSADWLGAPVLPLTLQAGNTSVPVRVTVPSGVVDGTYTVQVSCQFTFSGGTQSMVSRLNVQVGAGQNAFLPSWLMEPFMIAWAWSVAHFWLFAMSVTFVMMLVVVAAVARRRRVRR